VYTEGLFFRNSEIRHWAHTTSVNSYHPLPRRLAKEMASADAEDAAWRIVELQDRVAELEANNSLPRVVEVDVLERVRGLEMALLQAHIDYNLLCQGSFCMYSVWCATLHISDYLQYC
jgi:hypothetical protein